MNKTNRFSPNIFHFFPRHNPEQHSDTVISALFPHCGKIPRMPHTVTRLAFADNSARIYRAFQRPTGKAYVYLDMGHFRQ